MGQEAVQEFVVAFVETDGSQFDGVHAKVMKGVNAENVARERVAEAAKYYKEEHGKCSDGLAWEETQQACHLEVEEQVAKIITAWHPYYKVYVFTLDGEHVEVG